MAHRISRVRAQLSRLDADALLLTALPDIRWACGFTGSNGVLLVGSEEAHFVTDGRYTEQSQEEVSGATVHVAPNGLSSYLNEHDLLSSCSSIAFQSDDLTVSKRSALEDQHSDVDWVPVKQVLTALVAQKDSSEVECIRAAQGITEAVFEDVMERLRPGLTEREVAAEITYAHLKRGAEEMSFDPIVASGPNAARPHARPSERRLEEGDVVVIDMGGVRNGYASDMTRTVALGDPREAVRRGHEVVLTAQRKALAAAQAGVSAKALDRAAREVIEEAGLGEYFSHGLGHGIGLRVHEWPRVSRTAEDENLPKNTCITIEPGIYVPEDGYGIRIEDIVVLKDGGCVNLTKASKSLVKEPN